VAATKIENIDILSRVFLYLRSVDQRLYQFFTLVRDEKLLVEGEFFGVLQSGPRSV
jgi:hypothetical protein